MHDELVHVSRLLDEPGLPVAALFGCPEFVLEERVVLRPDDHEVVRHIVLCAGATFSDGGVCWMAIANS